MYKIKRKRKSRNKTALIQTSVFTVAAVSGLLLNNHWKETNSIYLQSGIQVTSTPIPISTPIPNVTTIPNTTTIPIQQANQVSRGDVQREEFVPDKVIKAIENNLDGVFDDKAKFIFDTSKANNVNPMLMAAIMKWETTNGTSKLVRNAKNPGGINWYEGCGYPKIYDWYILYPSLEKGIEENIKLIKDFYIDEGKNDITSIGLKYCPPKDKRNGIAGMDNNAWIPQVTKMYQKILSEAKG